VSISVFFIAFFLVDLALIVARGFGENRNSDSTCTFLVEKFFQTVSERINAVRAWGNISNGRNAVHLGIALCFCRDIGRLVILA